MLRIYPNEIFREIEIDYPLKFRYAVSSRGRLISYSQKHEDGHELHGKIDGYKVFRCKIKDAEGNPLQKQFFVYKLIAELFLPRTSDDQKHVLHLDFDRGNDALDNLKWATYEEKIAHNKKSPHVIRAKQKLLEHNIKSDGRKLTVTKVIHLKKLLADPNRKTRMKILAKQFGISEMQLFRIKSGENWGHIKI